MATIKSATYGDESNTTDVTSIVAGKMVNGKLTLKADDSVLPLITLGSDKVELTQEETDQIKAQAIKECNSANDKKCIDATSDRISQAKLQEKLQNLQRSKGVVGARLNVTIVDEKGRERTLVIPKGQTLSIGDTEVEQVPSEKTGESGTQLLTSGIKKFGTLFMIVGIIIGVALWAYSVGATWRAFMEEGYSKPGYIATAIAILVPLSGFVITPVFYGFLKYFA